MVISNSISQTACASFANDDGQLVCEGGETQNSNRVLLENDPNVPDGTYLESCGGCHIVQDDNDRTRRLLSCTACPNWNGATYASQLDLASCKPGSNIGNDDGRLVCGEDGIPKGTYQESCRDCRSVKGLDNSVAYLTCRCVDAGGRPHGSVLYPPRNKQKGKVLKIGLDVCDNIANDNGELVCEENETTDMESGSVEEDLPPGSYQDSCEDCQIITTSDSKQILTCKCQDDLGNQHRSVLGLGHGKYSDIDNKNGVLEFVGLREEEESDESDSSEEDTEENDDDNPLDFDEDDSSDENSEEDNGSEEDSDEDDSSDDDRMADEL